MYRSVRRVALVMATIAMAATPLAAQETDTEADVETQIESAAGVAIDWLGVLDAGDYDVSWEQAAPAFQQAVTAEQWAASADQARAPFEPFGERERIGAQHAVDPPNTPPGEYVVLQYRTQVSGGRTVVETVVPMKTDAGWKVSGYFVRPE